MMGVFSYLNFTCENETAVLYCKKRARGVAETELHNGREKEKQKNKHSDQRDC